MKEKKVKLTPKEMKDYFSNHNVKENEFRGKILSWTLDIEQLLDDIISNCFVKDYSKLEFLTIVLPRISLREKIRILELLLKFKENSNLKKNHPHIIENLCKIRKNRNMLAHRNSDLFENIVNSKQKKNDIILIRYDNGKVFPDRLTPTRQTSMDKLIKKCIFELRQISNQINLNKKKK